MSERYVMQILVPLVAGLAPTASALSPAAAADGGSAARHGPVAAVARRVPPIPPNIDVSQQLGNHAEDAIAANPNDPQNVVAISMRGNLTHGLFVGVTFDRGLTFTKVTEIIPTPWTVPGVARAVRLDTSQNACYQISGEYRSSDRVGQVARPH